MSETALVFSKAPYSHPSDLLLEALPQPHCIHDEVMLTDTQYHAAMLRVCYDEKKKSYYGVRNFRGLSYDPVWPIMWTFTLSGRC